ncbi:MAG: hypothetical protein ABSG37_07140 [Candidatus Limnocylindrales bacterium]
MRHFGRVCASAAIAVGIILPFAGPSVKPVAATVWPTQAGCPGGHQAWIHVAGTVTHQQYYSYYVSGGSPTTIYLFNTSSSALKLNYDFCTNKTAASPSYWYIYGADVSGTQDVGVDSALNVTGAYGGYALRPYEVIGGSSNSVVVQPSYCTQGSNPFTTLAALASLPIPGVNYAFSVGQVIASAVFTSIPGPAGKCRALGMVSMPVSINSVGSTTVGGNSASYYFDKGRYPYNVNCNSGAATCSDLYERFIFSMSGAN